MKAPRTLKETGVFGRRHSSGVSRRLKEAEVWGLWQRQADGIRRGPEWEGEKMGVMWTGWDGWRRPGRLSSKGEGTTVKSEMVLGGNSQRRKPYSSSSGCLPVSVLGNARASGSLPWVFLFGLASSVAGICLVPQPSLGWFEKTPDRQCCPGWLAPLE